MGQLQKTDRQEIEHYLKKGYKAGKIASILEKPRSTITREIHRNLVEGEYIAKKAHIKSYQRRYWVLKEPQKIRNKPDLVAYIEAKLKLRNPWSPETIAERWKIEKGFCDYFEAHSVYHSQYAHFSILIISLFTH